MSSGKVYTVIGLMSGTSLDGIDAALIRTDGRAIAESLGFVSVPYDEKMRDNLRACLGLREDPDTRVGRTENEITRAHAAAVDWLLSMTGRQPQDIDLIGFHGQTIFHDPAGGFTWQIGNGPALARLTGIDVVNDFRSADVAAGGEGAPLLPLYHRALAARDGLEKPLAVLNLGGVGNVTYLGPEDETIAFDTGPANALINDLVKKATGREFDEGGLIARQGSVDQALVDKWLAHPYFSRPAPKSLDRDAWQLSGVEALSMIDAAATLAAFTVQSVAKAQDHLPQAPARWLVTGGGRHNPVIMEGLSETLGVPVLPVETMGWNGDALEAEGFAWLAVRSVLGLPLSLPTTTGVEAPTTGGVFYSAVQDGAAKA